jgi:C4-dicarboxylate-specific signal transduction histidine kinase
VTQDGAEPQTTAPTEDGPDELLWDKARSAVASLESSTSDAPRWIAAISALIVALLLLLTSFFAGHINTDRARQTLRLTQHNTAVIDQTASVNLALLRVSVSLRSYALTGAGIHAETYLRNRVALAQRFEELAILVLGDSPQSNRTAQLKAEIDRYFADYDPTAGRSVPDRQDIVRRLSDPGVPQHDRQYGLRIRALFDMIADTERDARATARRSAETNQRTMQWIADACFVLAILSTAASLLLIQREKARGRMRELQLEFMHTQRLALMGQTTVAIAHEVNQPLTAASNYLAVLRNISAGGGHLPPEQAKELVPKIEHQIRRAGEIVQRLRNFLAVRGGERVSETPKTLIDDAVELLGTLDSSIGLETHVELGLPAVLVDRVQIQQVLVNLMRNALEAMKNTPERRLVLKAAVTPGQKVKISIEDNGPGLPDAVAKNLFKPFVSSKRSGMGVGLSICHTIITAHGGRIWADSTPQGTAFHFTLPAAREA